MRSASITFVMVCVSVALLVASCKLTERSDPKSFFSKPDNGDYPEVYRINVAKGNQGFSSNCTSVAIAPNTLLTAQHCFLEDGKAVKGEEINRLAVRSSIQVDGQKKIPVRIFALDDPATDATRLDLDLALVEFSDAIFTKFATLGETPPVKGDVSFVGYGYTGFVNTHAADIIFHKNPSVPAELLKGLAVEKQNQLLREHQQFIANRSSPEYAEIVRRINSIFVNPKQIGFNTLNTDLNAFADNKRLTFESRFKLKTDLDKKWFHLIQLLVPEGIVEDQERMAAVSSGDSGGPMFDDQRNLIGICQGTTVYSNSPGMAVYTSVYTNILSNYARSKFFQEAKAKGFAVPQVRKGDGTINPQPSPGPIQPNSDIFVQVSNQITVALASAENSNGDYYLAIASNESFSEGWFCPLTSLQDCGRRLKSNEQLPRLMSMQPLVANRFFQRTATKVRIAEANRNGFSIIMKRADGKLVGTSVFANRIK